MNQSYIFSNAYKYMLLQFIAYTTAIYSICEQGKESEEVNKTLNRPSVSHVALLCCSAPQEATAKPEINYPEANT